MTTPAVTPLQTTPPAVNNGPNSNVQKQRQGTKPGAPYHGENYFTIKAASEGGDKRMLDVVFERLKYTINAEWTEGQGVARILDTFEDVTVPQPDRLSAEDRQDDLLVAIWKEKVKRHVVKVEALEDAKGKLYSTVWKLLSKVLRNKVSGQKDFSQRNEVLDVVWLLKTVRALVTDFDSAMPEVLSVSESLERIVSYRQSEKMENSDYVKNLLSLIKVYEQYCGPYGVHMTELKRIDNMLSTTVDDNGVPLNDAARGQRRTEAIKESRERAIAMQIIRGACKRRFSRLRNNLATDYGLNVDKYPVTIDAAVNALNVAENQLPPQLKKTRGGHEFTFAHTDNDGMVAGTNGKLVEHITCHKCKSVGHYANHCPQKDLLDSQPGGQVSTRVLCQSHLMSGEQSVNHIQLTTTTATLDRNIILLDSQSTVHVFNNKELLTDIRMHPEGRTLRVFTNGGHMDSQMVGRFGDIDVWYNPNSIANILSLALIVDCYHVTMDSRVEHAFILWLDKESYIKFHKSQRLFIFNSKSDRVHQGSPGPSHGSPNVSLVQTVANNERLYRRREIESAKVANDISKLLFHPAQTRLEKIVGGNFVSNLPITIADVKRAEKIYGPSVPSIKGRTTRRQPAPVQDLLPVGIPRDLYEEYKSVTVCLDFFYINKMPVLHAISRKLNHRWVCFPETRSLKEMKRNFTTLRRIYHTRGFRIFTVHADEEFEKLRSHILPGRLVTPDPGGHVPEVERSIRTLKEGCRAAIHGMPYSYFPKEMLRGLLRKVVLLQNAFPSDHGVSDTLSPRNIIDNLPHLNFNDIKIPFGTYAQLAVDEQITNTPRPRTIGAIVLDPVGLNHKYRYMSLESGRRVSGRIAQVLPITDEVIARVNDIGSSQKQPRTHDGRLLFEWRPGFAIDDDVYLMAGVYEDPPREEDLREELVPEPIQEEVPDDDFEAYEGDGMREVTEEEDSISENDDESESEDSTDNGSSSDDSFENDDDESLGDDIDDGNLSDNNEGNLEDMLENDHHGNVNESESDGAEENESKTNDEILGRGQRLRNPNPKYYSGEFTHLQFLQQSFESLDGDSRLAYLKYALEDYCISGKTQLLERYLSGVVLTQMSARAGLIKHGKNAEKVLMKEFAQFKDMDVMEALDPDLLTKEQIQQALNMVNIIQEKRDHTPENPHLKFRGCADGSKQRGQYSKEETTSPTNGVDAFLLTLMTDAMERRDVAISDIVGAYLNAEMDDFVVMKVTGREAELMCELNPEWKKHLRYDKRKRAILYVVLKKALYGCVKSALLWYELYSGTLKELGFKINPYDQCVANKIINGSQCTICWYVDDNKISHVDPGVVTSVIHQIEAKFGKMKVSRGKEHEFLGMKIIFHDNGTVSVDMKEYIKKSINEFTEDIIKNASTPATRFLFKVRDDAKPLDKPRAEVFHRIVARLLYVCKRGRLDIQNAIGFLTTRVSRPDEDDWNKLKRVLQYLRGTLDDKLVLGAVDIGKMKSFVDASFAVHPDMRSHTGGGISWGIGILLSMCQKQRLNAKSSTEAEVIGVSDFLSNMIWARMFLEQQGYEIEENLLYQDNQSAIKIESNGSKSCSRRSRHIDMRYFFIKDRLESEHIKVVYCPTEQMIADFFTKPLQGKLFHYLKSIIMGHQPLTTLTSRFPSETQERVGNQVPGEDSVSTEQKSRELKDSKKTMNECDVVKNISFHQDLPTTEKASYAEVTKGLKKRKYPLIDFYPKTKK